MADATQPLVNLWAAGPIAVLLLLGLLIHATTMRRDREMPSSRRRIRTVSSAVAATAVPALLAGFAIIPPAWTDAFAMVWLTNLSLIFLVLVLVAIDMLNTFRLALAARRDGRARMRALRAEVDRLVRDQQRSLAAGSAGG